MKSTRGCKSSRLRKPLMGRLTFLRGGCPPVGGGGVINHHRHCSSRSAIPGNVGAGMDKPSRCSNTQTVSIPKVSVTTHPGEKNSPSGITHRILTISNPYTWSLTLPSLAAVPVSMSVFRYRDEEEYICSNYGLMYWDLGYTDTPFI